jgi:polygalacturonase
MTMKIDLLTGCLLALTLYVSRAATPLFHDIRDYGAVGDGATPATAAIQKAVDACAVAGGGKVIIPSGRYVSGPIFLKSRVHIELESGALLLGSTNLSDYPGIDGRWEGIERKIYASLFTGQHLEQVSITGRGIIDAQGAVWWNAHRQTGELRKQAGLQGREPENPAGAPLRWPRPRVIYLHNCTNVLVRDLTLVNSPSWTVHPVYCENVTIDNLTITNPEIAPNTDAVDPDSCKNVRITNCRFDVGDDCVVIKSGYNEDGRRVGIPCENILVSNCLFLHGHGGVVIGSEMSGSVRNVAVVNCVFDGTERGLRVKTSLGRGGVVEDFLASNLIMRNLTDAAFAISATYADSVSGPATGAPARETIPVLRHFYWSDVTVTNVKKVADLSGLAESPLEDFRLSRLQVRSAQTGFRCVNAKDVVLEELNLEVASGAAVELLNVSNLDLLRLTVPKPNAGAPVVSFQNVSQALLRECKVKDGPGVFLHLAGAGSQAITLEQNRLAAGIQEQAAKP